MFLRNVGKCLPEYAASCPRRQNAYSNRSLLYLRYSFIFITIIFIITTDLVLLSGRWDSSLRG
jgi:hypothetical protein